MMPWRWPAEFRVKLPGAAGRESTFWAVSTCRPDTCGRKYDLGCEGLPSPFHSVNLMANSANAAIDSAGTVTEVMREGGEEGGGLELHD